MDACITLPDVMAHMYVLQFAVSMRPAVKYFLLTALSLSGPHTSSLLNLRRAAIYEYTNMVTILYRMMIHEGIGISACQYIGHTPQNSWHPMTQSSPTL